MRLRTAPLALLLALSAGTVSTAALSTIAQANQAGATACAAQLTPDGRTLYDKVAPTMTAKTNIKDALTAVARPMVMNGSMSREKARPAAEAAGECLKQLQ
jgi:hypothetical protein